ncbi:MAG: chromosome segregation protein SMC [Sphingobacteriales bacterium]|nr:chromosome segregation protein SMC [Sphingobacteriales bacterium]MBP9141992.1 chromosome segregation protein SMC [Chitinophagales bacterium]MDA0198952.1 chromosome segregation protein SMC [Bacteroidota bacterium]MBK7528572.1 chromosome segregation protein SMC [Sphingobacteriales bacterium]MBL0246671.1 chromosome segregation protein SMC [Sphingobacteriales bacterium]
MRLKTLEIKGFKSFADQTVIHFNDALTGIVGPNGCGKSNTVDAIRWVLGEQRSKALRLEKMDNIIFNGTKKRKSSGRAEVALTFENTRNLLPTEFSNVTVSRILYRTGESEYRLNDVKCRLKDIYNLFMDTGISSDSYAIIELKMIDELLNDNDDSRRRLFEQAAGISKYKIRKKETLSKLESTDADLQRVEDLLHEIETNLKTLERQAKRTEKYYQLKEDYKTTSIALTLYQLADFKQVHQTNDANLKQENDRKIAIEAQMATLEAQIEEQKNTALTHEQELALIQKQLNDHLQIVNKAENDKSLLTQNTRFLREKREQLTRQIETTNTLRQNLQKEVDILHHDQTGETAILEKTTQLLNELKAIANTKRTALEPLRNQLNRLQAVLRDTERQIFDTEKQIAVKTSQKETYSTEINTNRIKFQSQQSELDDFIAQRNKTQNELTHASEILQAELAEETTIQQAISIAQQQIDQIANALNHEQRQLDAKRNEYKLTKSLVESLEGFPDSIVYLQKNKNWQPAPLLLDTFSCPDQYKAALENVLKPWLNYYVVNDINEAMQAIKLLDTAQKGKAGFFVLNHANNTAAKQNPDKKQHEKPHPEAIYALDLVQTADQYLPLFTQLLNNVFIVSNTAAFEQLSPKNQTIVTPDGRLIAQGTSILGGSAGAYEGKRIGKARHLEQLNKEITKLETTATALTTQRQQQQTNLTALNTNLKNKQQLVQHHRTEANKLQNLLGQFNFRIENANLFLQESETKQQALKIRIAETGAEISQLQETLQDLVYDKGTHISGLAALQTNFSQAETEATEASADYNQQNIEFHKQQNRLNSITQNLQFKTQQLAELKQQLTTATSDTTTTANQLLADEQQLSQYDASLANLYQQKNTLENQVTKAETAYFDLRGNIAELEKTERELQKRKEQSEVLINAQKDRSNELRIKLLSLKERLSLAFKVNLDDLLEQEPNLDLDRTTLEEEVSKQAKRIENYGEINPLAIEAYNEIKERYDFIVTQRDDLLAAKNSLLATIKEIEDTATEKFMAAFNAVRQNFQYVFRSLFTHEDQCDLTLLEPNNPLDSPIEIMAKPKGKRPQSINQLSGGEKSLTALALVFSLYLLKPAPFCILDEVDAPLDDNNVGKFTKIIREFADKSQFIIVTHNKNTMASVDIIYGVTMQEEGVSKVVAVDFRELAA